MTEITIRDKSGKRIPLEYVRQLVPADHPARAVVDSLQTVLEEACLRAPYYTPETPYARAMRIVRRLAGAVDARWPEEDREDR